MNIISIVQARMGSLYSPLTELEKKFEDDIIR